MNHNHESKYTGEEWPTDIAHGNRPWYLRHVPGRHETFAGHVMAASIYGIPGILMLLLALHRARKLAPGQSFTATHVPERNSRMLAVAGGVMMVFWAIGMVEEASHTYNVTRILEHTSMYMQFFPVFLCMVLEGLGKLPPDMHRCAMAVACLQNTLEQVYHSRMKELPVDVLLHAIGGWVSLTITLVLTYSIKNTDSLFAYLATPFLLILQATWLVFVGLFLCCIPLSIHMVLPYLTCFALTLLLVILAVYVIFGPKYSAHSNSPFEGDKQEDDDEAEALL